MFLLCYNTVKITFCGEMYMLKRLLLSAIVLSSIYVSCHAIDVDLPGANSKIPEDEYKDYVYLSPKIALERIASTQAMINQIKADGTFEKLKEWRKISDDAELEKTLRHDFKQFMTPIDGQTEIIEHTENSGIQLTVPFSSVFKIQNSEHNYTLEGLTGSTYVARDYNVVEKDGSERTFIYKKLDNTKYWNLNVTNLDKSNQGTIVGITFTSKDNPNTSHSIGTYVAGSESESERNIKANRILANYVLPSVRSLNRLNEFSTITMSKNLQYRVLNGSTRTESTDKDSIYGSKSYTVTHKGPHGVNQVLQMIPLHDKQQHFLLNAKPDDLYNFETHIEYINSLYGHTLNKEIRLSRISKSFVWFDGIPGLLLDYELSNGEGRLEFITRDKDYEYRHIVLYRVNGYYTLEQLKNMLLDVKLLNTGDMYNRDINLFNLRLKS